MKTLLIILAFLLILFLGAIGHEADMARNFAEHGDAKALFFDIKR